MCSVKRRSVNVINAHFYDSSGTCACKYYVLCGWTMQIDRAFLGVAFWKSRRGHCMKVDIQVLKFVHFPLCPPSLLKVQKQEQVTTHLFNLRKSTTAIKTTNSYANFASKIRTTQNAILTYILDADSLKSPLSRSFLPFSSIESC